MSEAAALTPDEVAALVDGIGTHQKEAAGAAQPYRFGTETARPMAALPALDRMNERAARRLRQLIEPFSRLKPAVTAQPVAIRRFEAWRAEQPEFTSIGLYRSRPLKGGMLIAIEPELIGRLVDCFYGGPGIHGERKIREFTPTEERLLARLSEALVQTLTEVWADVIPLKPQLSARETNIAHASLVRGDEPVALARLTISLGQGRPNSIDIVYPLAALRAIEPQLTARIHEEAPTANTDWRDRIEAALGEVRVEARSVLARPSLSVAELMKLAPGDVIPISLPALVPLLVAGRTVALGKIGEQDGRAALRIEKIEDRGSVQ